MLIFNIFIVNFGIDLKPKVLINNIDFSEISESSSPILSPKSSMERQKEKFAKIYCENWDEVSIWSPPPQCIIIIDSDDEPKNKDNNKSESKEEIDSNKNFDENKQLTGMFNYSQIIKKI